MKRKYKKEEGNRKEGSRGGLGMREQEEREEQAFQVPENATTLPKQLDPLD